MSKAFLDTAVLTDVLIKPGPKRAAAKAVIARFDVSLLPVYAIKEFKAGPLRNFAWLHNRLVQSGSFEGGLEGLQRLSLSFQRYLPATAIEALRVSAYENSKVRLSELVAKYGPDATWDQVQLDEHRLQIKAAVFKAWRNRRRVTDQVVEPLECYKEVPPRIERGLIVFDPCRCQPVSECCLGSRLRSDIAILKKLKMASERQVPTRETQRRTRALTDIIRKPKSPVSEEMCRALGDAIIVYLAPADSTILTTNQRDHQPLAESIGKKSESP